MRTYVVSLGLAGDRESSFPRRNASMFAAFELGLAWHGGQDAIFLRTDKAIDEIIRHVRAPLDEGEFVIVAELAHNLDVGYAGILFDEDGFEELFQRQTNPIELTR